ncbi:uncharacterized protein UBRO_20331 [Ustilago bromivora]|uniref:Uncharacterized protein n=1 Tax=Ustilago bromivora TaxID=307758 RepID=A0A1K0G0T1_9BASI|nr:uncharacterized protein UBRO_20331 [Ustilago bromivora]
MAAVISKVGQMPENVRKDFAFQARGNLLYKNKPGNSKDNIAHYQPLSLLDSDTHAIHSVIVWHFSAFKAAAMPHTQVAILSGRDSSKNTFLLMILAEANAKHLLRRQACSLHFSRSKEGIQHDVQRMDGNDASECWLPPFYHCNNTVTDGQLRTNVCP